MEYESEQLAIDESILSNTLHQLADKDIEQGNYQKALIVLQDALKNDPENDALKQKIEKCQDEIERDKQDMTTQEKLNRTLKEREIIQYLDAQATHELADHQMAEGNYRAAFYGLRKAQDVEPNKKSITKKLRICSNQMKNAAHQMLQDVRDYRSRAGWR